MGPVAAFPPRRRTVRPRGGGLLGGDGADGGLLGET
jgi:hypothetical protein